MIDWLTVRVAIQSAVNLRTGEVSSVDADGVVQWVSPKRKSVEGSYSGTITVRRLGTGLVEFAGSPAKFLQGHNLFGNDDLRGLGAAMIERACAAIPLELSNTELASLRAGQYDLTRLDINYSFATGSRENSLAWIEKAAAVASLRHRGRGRLRKSTVAWGEGSRYWKLKAYSKGQELEARNHGLPANIPMRSELTRWSDDKLRIELEIHGRQLRKLGLERGASWCSGSLWELFRAYLTKLRFGGELLLSATAVESLPYRLRQTYSNWVNGQNLRQLMSAPTYYRHRKQLLKHGINIGVPPTQDEVTKLPLGQYLEAACSEVPVWALGTELYFNPSKLKYEELDDGRATINVSQESGVTRTSAICTPAPPKVLVVTVQPLVDNEHRSERMR